MLWSFKHPEAALSFGFVDDSALKGIDTAGSREPRSPGISDWAPFDLRVAIVGHSVSSIIEAYVAGGSGKLTEAARWVTTHRGVPISAQNALTPEAMTSSRRKPSASRGGRRRSAPGGSRGTTARCRGGPGPVRQRRGTKRARVPCRGAWRQRGQYESAGGRRWDGTAWRSFTRTPAGPSRRATF